MSGSQQHTSDGGANAQPLNVEALAQAMWDAREVRDPSGELTGCTEEDRSRAPVFWCDAIARKLWPGSIRDQRAEAELVIALLASPVSERTSA